MSTSQNALLKNDRLVFSGIFAVGFAACTFGIGKAPIYGWAHPISILGYGLGGVALLLGAQVIFRARIFPLRSDRQAIYLLLGIIAVKVLLAGLYR